MTTTSKKQAAKPATKKPASKAVAVGNGKTEAERNKDKAGILLSSEYSAFRVISCADKAFMGETDVKSLIEQFKDQAAAANNGDMKLPEAMLMNQAVALQSLFARLTERGIQQDHMHHLEGFMRLALRAQNQCRATLETLAAIKNPPVIFAKQANINHGNQQVNNGATAPAPATHTKEIEIEPNQLLEVDHGSKTLDTGTTSATGRKDYAMAAVD